jgi:AAA family ATP:ADP antiporter
MVKHEEQESHASFPAFKAIGEPTRNGLERFLSFFADVRAGEGWTALALMVNVFLLLGSYYMLKTARESLILSEGTAEVKTYSSAAQAVLLAILVPFYGWVATKVDRGRLLGYSTLFFFSNLLLFWVLGQANVKEGIAYFIWTGVFNTFVISQFWQFANDLFTEPQGKRLFPMIGIGSSLGAWLGAKLAGDLSKTFSPYNFMLIGALVLLVCLALTMWVNRRESARAAAAASKDGAAAAAPLGAVDGFQLLIRDRYLLLIALLVLLLNIVNTSGEYMLSKLVSQEAARVVGAGPEFAKARGAFIGQFYGDFFAWVNLLGFLFQAFLVSRLFRYIGVGATLFMLPIISFTGYTLLAVAPILWLVRSIKILENATDYSINNTVRHALFLNTSRESKYKAKAAIDTFFMRGGDVVAAGVVFLAAQNAVGLSTFAAVVVALVVLWLFICWRLAQRYQKRSRRQEATAPAR